MGVTRRDYCESAVGGLISVLIWILGIRTDLTPPKAHFPPSRARAREGGLFSRVQEYRHKSSLLIVRTEQIFTHVGHRMSHMGTVRYSDVPAFGQIAYVDCSTQSPLF